MAQKTHQVSLNKYSKGDRQIIFMGMVHVAPLSYYKSIQNLISSSEFGLYEAIGRDPEYQLSPIKKKWFDEMHKMRTPLSEGGSYIHYARSLGMTTSVKELKYPDGWINADISLQHHIEHSDMDSLKIMKSQLAQLKTYKSLGKITQGDRSLLTRVQSILARTKLSLYHDRIEVWILRKSMKAYQSRHKIFRDELVMKYIRQWEGGTLSDSKSCTIIYGQGHMSGISSCLLLSGYTHESTEDYDPWKDTITI